MPKKALVDFNFIKELCESVDRKGKRSFRGKIKSKFNGSKREKKIEEIRHLLMAATKSDSKSSKKPRTHKPDKRSTNSKRTKTFSQFDSRSGTESSSDSSSGSETESSKENAKSNSEGSCSEGQSGCDSGTEDKQRNQYNSK